MPALNIEEWLLFRVLVLFLGPFLDHAFIGKGFRLVIELHIPGQRELCDGRSLHSHIEQCRRNGDAISECRPSELTRVHDVLRSMAS